MRAHLLLHSVIRIEIGELVEHNGTRWRDVRFVAADGDFTIGAIAASGAIAPSGGGISVEVAPEPQECAA
jgi:hypothetical protein